jgi:outer membrane protein OmpA-like peptidoglycan-associated protein
VSGHKALRAGAIAALLITAAACAPVPRPLVLGEVDAVRGGAAASEASSLAPGAFAAAEKIRKEANAAFIAGDNAGSQILGEHALAAYAHAAALARIARAEAGADAAQTSLAASKSDLGGLDADQVRLAAEADAFELKVRVARDAQPIEPSGRADPERERARTAAAKALALQARLLCGAARLLQGAPATAITTGGGAGAGPVPDPKQLEEATAALGKVEAQLGDGAKSPAGPAPIDEATRARAGCLAALTAIRRAATPVSRAPGAGDALLTELSAMGTLSPSRDDRGVVVAFRGLFDGRGALVPAANARLAEIGKIAAAHPAFPVEVIVHNDKPVSAKDEAGQRARGEAVAKAIAATARGARIETIVAGNAAPVVDPAGADRARNSRVEIVFVTPETF